MEKIQYGSTLYGECCSGNVRVFINSHDIFKMGRFLGLKNGDDEFEFTLPHPSFPGKDQDEYLDPEAERKDLAEELDFELRYYRLLSTHEADPSFLWNFPLNQHKNFEEKLKGWEESE